MGRHMDHIEEFVEEDDDFDGINEENLLQLMDKENNNENNNSSAEEQELKIAIRRPIRAHFIQICVVAMHQNGRDTHIRQVKVFGPRSEAVSGKRLGYGRIRENVLGFTSIEMTQFDVIR